MRLLTVLATGGLVVSGCAYHQPPPVVFPQNPDPTPVCTTKKECEAMWTEAQSVISSIAGMRVRLVTDSMIETYAQTQPGRLTGKVLKMPEGEGCRFDATFNCDNHYFVGCNPYMATDAFNKRLNAVKSR